MGIFDKKYCDICGEKIGLFGNRKLEDGNLCKTCAQKLSPWFSERRKSTVAEIKEQLAYREENREAVAAFHTSRTLGMGTKVLLDEDAGWFMVSGARDLAEANPDVLDFSDVTGCRVDVDEQRRELKREGPDGKQVSYQPARYEYSYDFYVIINVNNPYFNEIRFRLNNRSIEINNLGGVMVRSVDPRKSVDYLECEKLGQQIVDALTQVREQVRQSAEQANAPKQSVKCPCCGAVGVPSADGTCEFCGSVLPK